MSSENEWEAREAELAGIVQEALRRETPPGLRDEQRARLMAAARAGEKPRWRVWMASTAFVAAAACATLAWVEYGEEQERARLEQEAAQAAEQQALQAEQQRRDEREAELATRAERARREAEEAALAARAASDRAKVAASAPAAERCEDMTKAEGSKADRASVGGGSKASKAGQARGGCDPNDPLCGL